MNRYISKNYTKIKIRLTDNIERGQLECQLLLVANEATELRSEVASAAVS